MEKIHLEGRKMLGKKLAPSFLSDQILWVCLPWIDAANAKTSTKARDVAPIPINVSALMKRDGSNEFHTLMKGRRVDPVLCCGG